MALRRSLGKDADGPVSRFVNRPLSTRLSMVLAPLRPAPDLVSLVAFALGLAGATLLDGVLDRVADAAILAGLGVWALDGHHRPPIQAPAWRPGQPRSATT